ncbi:MAG: hypothetical protein IKB93_03080 [Clostridia bacterium]|nr:hypothetical protein [Clostridia bacterium]
MIKKKTIDLKTDTIIVKETGTASANAATNTYTITHITSGGTVGNETYNMYSSFHQKKLATSAVLKVDISDVRYASDFSLNFTFDAGTCVGNCLKVYYVPYKNGEALMDTLSSNATVTGASMPQAIVVYADRLVYEYKNTDGINKEVIEEVSAETDLLKEHLDTAINNEENSIYLLISCDTPVDEQENANAYFKLYTSCSAEKAPLFSVEEVSLTSEVVKTESGYTYKVGNLDAYSENAMIIVAVYNSKDEFVMAATTTKGEDIVDIVCDDAASIRAYIWESGTLEPVTYVEKIDL